MIKILLASTLLGTALFANMATSAVKHKIKKELKYESHKIKNKDLDVNKKLKKEKRKVERKAIKAVL